MNIKVRISLYSKIKHWVKTFVWQLRYGGAPWGSEDGYPAPPPCHLSGSIQALLQTPQGCSQWRETETRKSAFQNRCTASVCHENWVRWKLSDALNFRLLKTLPSSWNTMMSKESPSNREGSFYSEPLDVDILSILRHRCYHKYINMTLLKLQLLFALHQKTTVCYK